MKMRCIRKIISVILSFTIIASCFASPVYAACDDIAYTVGADNYKLRIGTIQCNSLQGDGYKSSYFYSDGYFFEDPKLYNEHLATLSMILDLELLSHSNNKSKKLLNSLGFSNYYANEYFASGTDTEDSIGFSIASKGLYTFDGKDTGKTLIVIGVRSSYQNEWANNALLGGSGEAKGFSDQAGKIVTQIDEYIANNNLQDASESGKLVFWICGYSRGAAVANLTAKKLIDGKYAPYGDAVFGYTFATPLAGQQSELVGANTELYMSIHNIINYDDIVTHVAPAEYGFIRYGQDHDINSLLSDSDYLEWLSEIDGEYEFYTDFHGAYIDITISELYNMISEGISFDEIIKTYDTALTQGQYIDDASRNMIGKWMSDRNSSYVTRTFNDSVGFEKALCNVLYIMQNLSSSQMTRLTELFSGCEDELSDLALKNTDFFTFNFYNWYKKTRLGFPYVYDFTKINNIETVWDFINDRNVDGNTIEGILGSEIYDRLKDSFYVLADACVTIASHDYNEDYNSISVSSEKLYLVATILYNFYKDQGSLVVYHYPDFYLAAVLTQDSFYDSFNVFVNGSLLTSTLVDNPYMFVCEYDSDGKMLSAHNAGKVIPAVSKDCKSTDNAYSYTINSQYDFKIYFLDDNYIPTRSKQ